MIAQFPALLFDTRGSAVHTVATGTIVGNLKHGTHVGHRGVSWLTSFLISLLDGKGKGKKIWERMQPGSA